ncbi:MAG: cupin domain-containing protein [Rhodospirillaceae bacterium]
MLRIFAFSVVLAGSGALAADSGVTRSIFGRMDAPAGYETVVGSADLPPGAAIGRHTHHGTEFGYIAAGEVEFAVEGQPPYRLKAGGFYKIDAGKIHDVRNLGGDPAKAVATWVIEKGKPLAEPAK